MKIGFLPLYIELYDRSGSTSRDRLEPFYETLARAFEEKGIEVVRSSFCRLEEEFKNAVNKFEENQGLTVLSPGMLPTLLLWSRFRCLLIPLCLSWY